MRTNITLALTTALLATQVHAQNSCTSALPVTAGTWTVDAINGPEIPVPICTSTGVGATHTEWYSYTPAQDYSLTITTDLAQNAGGDTRLNIYEASCGSLSCIGGADDQGSNTLASATVQVSSGLTYRFSFDDRWSNAGFDFQVIEGPPVVTEFSFSPTAVSSAGHTIYAAVDMNGDFLDDVVGVATSSVMVNRQLSAGGFSPVTIPTPAADHPASWSLAAGDIDNNGLNDLQYGNGAGVTYMLQNATGTSFTEQSFPEYVFSQRGNMIDINSDGNLDAFMCHDVDANTFFMNDGAGVLSFNQGGLGETCGNYGSIWIDYDNDHDMDLFVAKCGCDPVDILYRNNGDGTFTNVAPALGFADSHQSWSSAWGDFDNDGDMDVLVGSSSSPVHKLLRNNGGTFTNITVDSGFDLSGGSSIEWTTHDFNNDGYLDVLGGGYMMVNNGDMTFTKRTDVPGNGPIGDLNNDGFLDILNGATVYLNSGNTNKHLTVVTIGTVSNYNGIGARVEVTSAMGTQVRDVKSGDGFKYMSSLNTHFGLGTDTQVEQVRVIWPSGIIDIVEAPAINSTVVITEGSFNVGINDAYGTDLSVFPNPATDVLYVRAGSSMANAPVQILDMAGRLQMETSLRNDQVDISSLPTGVYMLRVMADRGPVMRKFVKR
jgi:hypothetical protein